VPYRILVGPIVPQIDMPAEPIDLHDAPCAEMVSINQYAQYRPVRNGDPM
jgi:hypothetical protein